MTKLTLTDKKLIGMLKENTGVALCDSGDFYGRNWKRNQARAFIDEPKTSYEFNGYGIEFTHNLFHWLRERLEYLPDWQRKFSAFANRKDQEDCYWLQVIDNFLDSLKDKGYNVGGLYGDGNSMTINTYNGEDALSQTIQYVYTEINNETVIFLQIHGGCDVRGGYTAPKCFGPINQNEDIFDNARASMVCQGRKEATDYLFKEMKSYSNRHCWDTYNAGYTWYGANDEPELYDVEPKSFEELELTPDDLIADDKNNVIAVPAGLGVIAYDEETNKGYCPICGTELEIYPFP